MALSLSLLDTKTHTLLCLHQGSLVFLEALAFPSLLYPQFYTWARPVDGVPPHCSPYTFICIPLSFCIDFDWNMGFAAKIILKTTSVSLGPPLPHVVSTHSSQICQFNNLDIQIDLLPLSFIVGWFFFQCSLFHRWTGLKHLKGFPLSWLATLGQMWWYT